MSNTIQIQKSLEFTGHKGAIYSVTKADKAGSFFTGGGEGQIVKWSLDNPDQGQVVAQIDSRVFSLLYLEHLNLLLVGNMEGGLYWIDLREMKVLSSSANHTNGVFDIHYLDDVIYTFGGDGKLTKWSIDSRMPIETLHLAGYSLRGASRLKTTALIAVGSSDNAIYLVDFKNMRLVDRIDDAHDSSVFSVKFTTDGRHLLSGGRDAHLKVWDVDQNFRNIVSHPAHMFTVNYLEVLTGKNLVATASRDKTIKLWDLETFDLVKVIDTLKNNCHINSVNRLLWLENEDRLISVSDDRRAMAWQIDITA
ncbi:MAG: hypothetical protein AAF502_01785 [Bacteroidota bacterium]